MKSKTSKALPSKDGSTADKTRVTETATFELPAIQVVQAECDSGKSLVPSNNNNSPATTLTDKFEQAVQDSIYVMAAMAVRSHDAEMKPLSSPPTVLYPLVSAAPAAEANLNEMRKDQNATPLQREEENSKAVARIAGRNGSSTEESRIRRFVSMINIKVTLKRVSRALSSHFGLSAIVVLYCIAGGFVFQVNLCVL